MHHIFNDTWPMDCFEGTSTVVVSCLVSCLVSGLAGRPSLEPMFTNSGIIWAGLWLPISLEPPVAPRLTRRTSCTRASLKSGRVCCSACSPSTTCPQLLASEFGCSQHPKYVWETKGVKLQLFFLKATTSYLEWVGATLVGVQHVGLSGDKERNLPTIIGYDNLLASLIMTNPRWNMPVKRQVPLLRKEKTYPWGNEKTRAQGWRMTIYDEFQSWWVVPWNLRWILQTYPITGASG